MVIAIDFDGTITETNEFPNVGKVRPDAVKVIKELQEHGHTCVLWTCRQCKDLKVVKDTLKEWGLEMPINESPYDNLNPLSRKLIADIYIDDRSAPSCFSDVNWMFIRNKLIKD